MVLQNMICYQIHFDKLCFYMHTYTRKIQKKVFAHVLHTLNLQIQI